MDKASLVDEDSCDAHFQELSNDYNNKHDIRHSGSISSITESGLGGSISGDTQTDNSAVHKRVDIRNNTDVSMNHNRAVESNNDSMNYAALEDICIEVGVNEAGEISPITEWTLDADIHCHRAPVQGTSQKARNQLIAVSILCFMFMIIEIIGGILSNSLALITDATHLASDLSSFFVGLFAIWLSKRPATSRMTYGFHRADVIGAFVSILIIWTLTGVLIYLAVDRIINPDYEIDANQMLIVAILGVVFNILMGIVLSGMCCSCSVPHGHSHFGGGSHNHSHLNEETEGNNDDLDDFNHSHSHSTRCQENNYTHNQVTDSSEHGTYISTPEESHSEGHGNSHNTTMERNERGLHDMSEIGFEGPNSRKKSSSHGHSHENMNVRAALIHVFGDLVQSIGVFIAAVIIKVNPSYKMADPICTFLFSVLVLCTTITVVRDIFYVFMEASPSKMNHSEIKQSLNEIPGVKASHSLHVWALTVDKTAVSVHVAIDDSVHYSDVLKGARKVLRQKYGLYHVTVQVEPYQHEIMQSCGECIGPKIKSK